MNTGASVDHDVKIGDFVHIAPHCTLCGEVEIGQGPWIGAGTTIIQGVHIGKGGEEGVGKPWVTIGERLRSWKEPHAEYV